MDNWVVIDEELRSRALLVVTEATRWLRSTAYWKAIDAESEALTLALAANDPVGVRRAVEELELLGPNRDTSSGEAVPEPVANRLLSVAKVLAATPDT